MIKANTIKKIDHLVITTEKPQVCLEFYKKLGFDVQDSGNRYQLFAGDFKINVHFAGKELHPHAKNVQIGSSDICFEISSDIDEFKLWLEDKGLGVELGLVERTGVRGNMKSIYLRDPDGNLLEFCSYE